MLTVLLTVSLTVLPAVLLAVLLLVLVPLLAWAIARPGLRKPAAIARGRMHQASITHADVVHLRTMTLLSFLGQRRALLAGRWRAMGLEEGK